MHARLPRARPAQPVASTTAARDVGLETGGRVAFVPMSTSRDPTRRSLQRHAAKAQRRGVDVSEGRRAPQGAAVRRRSERPGTVAEPGAKDAASTDALAEEEAAPDRQRRARFVPLGALLDAVSGMSPRHAEGRWSDPNVLVRRPSPQRQTISSREELASARSVNTRRVASTARCDYGEVLAESKLPPVAQPARISTALRGRSRSAGQSTRRRGPLEVPPVSRDPNDDYLVRASRRFRRRRRCGQVDPRPSARGRRWSGPPRSSSTMW